jgi:uncharacterized protein
MTTPKTGERRFDMYAAPSANDGTGAPGPLADLLDFWLDEFAESNGTPDAGQVAGCVATFSGFPGVYDAAAFTAWLASESVETQASKLADADETEGARAERMARESRAQAAPVERRSFTVSGLKIEKRSTDGKAVMRGHAAVFNSTSADLGGFREQVAPGAFTRTLEQGADVRALINHDPNLVLGRSKAGTLRLSQDETGLAVEIDPPDTTYARDLMASMERGDIDQMSFTFRTVKDDWAQSPSGTMRTLLDVDLLDVSPVTYPAYAATDIAARSAQESPAATDTEAKDRLSAMRRRLRLAQAT